ncbi:phosphatase PAP2 family protein [Modestobacter roseus]|uniref:Undecaprenyl-diphosphatase n=1 Tax=Modestobacter roseus TaxID=1181884 RepID=A0A562IPM5_9ACTN|nr:phosphatase PAP2 family protein [Modestobacter roseus]MQA35415.1 phosphatase PAP2 family protein [Modestobacter roseus]TWH72685.1 undecaprenyl-diphosphatase [Modestobacter roseus]
MSGRRRAALLTALAGSGVTALCSLAVADGRVGPAEAAVFHWVNDWPGSVTGALWAFQLLGVLGLPLVVAIGAAAYRRGRLVLSLALLPPVKLLVEHGLLKELVHRERPGSTIAGAVLRDVPAAGASFPSGHALIAFGAAVLLWPHLRPGWRAVAVSLAVLTSVARLHLGAHAPLDVVGGAAAGVTVGATLLVLVGLSHRESARVPSQRAV